MFQARDFILTEEGLAFAVTLGGVEDGRIIACLRYIRSSDGRWQKVNTRQAEMVLNSLYPHYLHYSQRRDVVLQAVPVEAVTARLQPRPRLQELLKHPAPSLLIARLQALIARLISLGLTSEHLGVTGSLLVGQYTESSDLDLVVYGREAFARARRAVRQGIALGYFEELTLPLWQESYRRRGCALSLAEYLWHERRKFNKGAIGGVKFDLLLVEESSGAELKSWRKLGHTTLQAKVLNDFHAFSTPACYWLDHPNIGYALSFSATYTGQAETGEWVEISGYLEQADDGEQRIVVGSSREAPGEYIKVIKPVERMRHAEQIF